MTRAAANVLTLLCLFYFKPGLSFFVPEQLPTLLSFVYTNIPPIRKGIDSRVGFGFRLGPNADVQVMLELGPQQNTAPIGPVKDGNSKRDTRRHPVRFRAPIKGSWLQAWKQQQDQVYNDDEEGVVPAQPPMDSDIIAHLHQLYKEQPTKNDKTLLSAYSANAINKDADVKNAIARENRPSDDNKVLIKEPEEQLSNLGIEDDIAAS